MMDPDFADVMERAVCIPAPPVWMNPDQRLDWTIRWVVEHSETHPEFPDLKKET